MANKKYNIKKVKAIFAEHGCKLLSVKYDYYDKLTYICSCGTSHSLTLNHFLKLKNKTCPACRTQSTQYTLDQARELYRRNGYTPLFLNYKNNKTPLKCLCVCGRRMMVSLNDMLRHKYRCKTCWTIAHSGANNHNYNPHLSDEQRDRSRDVRIIDWRKSIYKRDNWTCAKCHNRGGMLNAHHVYNFADYPERRYMQSNGVTLCRVCHLALHKQHGFIGTTAIDLYNFLHPTKNKMEKENYKMIRIETKQIIESANKSREKTKEVRRYEYRPLTSGYSNDYFKSIRQKG